ncbi:unnamed protein product [Gongylonema pulchrum]|uniref:Kinesin motor domain-containing protein n=1 Tax=Gongylonema pulchrum TaxID=637853 RepID=A0A183ECU1_9BILA|nr:unnamed protein product [Gongylonema pulchrum]
MITSIAVRILPRKSAVVNLIFQRYSPDNDSYASSSLATARAFASTISPSSSTAKAATSEIEIIEVAKEGEKADPSQFELLSTIGQVKRAFLC